MKQTHILITTIATCFMLFSGCRKTTDQPQVPDLAEVMPGTFIAMPLLIISFPIVETM